MSQQIETSPTLGASTNSLGITFGSIATIEFKMTPEKLLNKDVSGIELTMVDTVGIYVHKGSLDALIPWGNVVSFIF